MRVLVFLLFIILPIITGKRNESPPNFVIILTDDQDLLLKSLVPMKNLRQLIAKNGITFKHAYVNSPVCCPSRATLLTGLYPHNTGVVNNSLDGGCSSTKWQKEHEPNTLSAILKSYDYTTFYAGKYMNQYGNIDAGGIKHVPIGYDWWLGLKGNSKYFNYTLSINGTEQFFPDYYLTDNIANYALQFLNQNHLKEKKFSMILAPPAPHAPFTPAERHKHKFPNAKVLRTPSFNFSSHDKHWLVQMSPKYLPENVTNLDNIQRSRLQTLLAVDEMIGRIYSKLEEMEVLNKTYLIFTSDNGFHIGQFTQPWDKRQPYQTDIRVPLIISGPNVVRNTVSRHVVSFVDLVPTILDLANIKSELKLDGNSMKKFITKRRMKNDNYIFLEYWGEGNRKTVDSECYQDDTLAECTLDNWCKCQDSINNTYNCLLHFSRNEKIKLCRFQDDINFLEVYDLKNDPYELENINYNIPKKRIKFYNNVLDVFKHCKGKGCIV